MLEDVIKEYGGVEVTPMEAYTDIFRLGDGLIQKQDEPKGHFKANPIAYWKNDNNDKGHYRILFEDTFEETLKECQEADFSIINGVTYFGRKNVQEHASKMFAMIFDYDGVTDAKLNNFLHAAKIGERYYYPFPNYMVLSGHGLHLYYVFEEPVPLFPNIKVQLKTLKYALTEKMWNQYTSVEKVKQFQGINQGFRVIGGKTKIPGVRTRVFRMNTHPHSLEQLNEYVPKENRIDTAKLFKETKLSLSEAKELYPEWYEKIVVNKEPKGVWTTKRDLYDWWKRKILEGATHHHRYFVIMCLAIYAVKAGIQYDELKKDAFELIPFLNDINPEFSFTEKDVLSALECYDLRYKRFPIEDIVKISAISITKNKRNFQKQADHLEEARAIRDIRMRRKKRKWTDGNGRHDKECIVRKWRENNPTGKKADCIRETGLTKPTVYKWWEFDGIVK